MPCPGEATKNCQSACCFVEATSSKSCCVGEKKISCNQHVHEPQQVRTLNCADECVVDTKKVDTCCGGATVKNNSTLDLTSSAGTTSANDHNQDTVFTCIGLIPNKVTDIAIFDATGKLQSFSYKNGDIRDLCFSSHGYNAADLLTPCFDNEGQHGDPEETCFCGIDTSHLHAHVFDPRTCGGGEGKDDGMNALKKTLDGNDSERALMLLARLTLYPTSNTTHPEQLSILVDESKEDFKKCNSMEYDPVIPRQGDMAPIQVLHGDHCDVLVHDGQTNDLHLGHLCDACGDYDWHGTFELVATRKWQAENKIQLNVYDQAKRKSRFSIVDNASSVDECKETNCCNGGTCDKSESKTTVKSDCCSSDTCSSKAPKTGSDCTGRSCDMSQSDLAKQNVTCEDDFCIPRSTKISDCCSGGGCGNRDAVRKTLTYEETESLTCCSDESACSKPCCATGVCTKKGAKRSRTKDGAVRSIFFCSDICCASDISTVDSILTTISGVLQVRVNVILRQVIVDHDVTVISAQHIEAILNENRFGAKIEHDGGASRKVGRSRFLVEGICCSSEIPAIRSIVEPINGVTGVMINVTTKMVYVDHDSSITSASDICGALNEKGFGAHIEHEHSLITDVESSFVMSTFSITMCNVSAAENLQSYLKTLSSDHIHDFDLDLMSCKLTVSHNPLFVSAHDLAAAITEKSGISTKVTEDGNEGKVWDFDVPDEKEKMPQGPESRCMRPTVILSGFFWIISMLSFVGGSWEYLNYVGLISVAFGLPPIAIKALRTLRRCQFDTNGLMLFATLGAIALQEFTEAAAVAFLFSFSEWLETRATWRARNALAAIVNLQPEVANLIHPQTQELLVVSVRAVPVGAMVSVKSGDKIPCDGVVIEGSTTVDESSLTGESRPVRKSPGDSVQGGTVNSGNSQIVVQTTQLSDDSAVARLIRLVEEAQANRSETEKLVDSFARIYTPIILFSALCMCSIPWAFGRDVGRQWTEMGLVLVVIACPCALIISTPVSYVAGLAATAQKGILIKGGAYLEALGNVSQVFFDKTGTLTEGQFKLLHLDTIGNAYDRKEVLQYLSLMEERASHPLAQALVHGAKAEGVRIPESLFVKDHTFLPGEGISGVINGMTIYAGNKRLFSRLGLLESLSPEKMKVVNDWEESGGTTGFMSIGDEGIVCLYSVADAVRHASKTVLEEFRTMGIDVIMLTGDRRGAALAVGRQIGLTEEQVKSELLPEQKLAIITAAQRDAASHQSNNSMLLPRLIPKKKLVLMCGDGVNDAPSLAAADIGVAMGTGAALAMETADVTLMDSNISKLSYSIRMGARVIRKIKENVAFSLIVKFLVLGFALAGKASLWGAIASDVGAMILVTLNGMSLLPSQRNESDEVHHQSCHSSSSGSVPQEGKGSSSVVRDLEV